MKDVEDMTFDEIVDEFSKLLLNYFGQDEDGRFEKLYDKIAEKAKIDVDWEEFIAKIEIATKEKKYKFLTNSMSGRIFWAWMFNGKTFPSLVDQILYYGQRDNIRIKCITSDLKTIKKELTNKVLKTVFHRHYVVTLEFFLLNARRDVIEWALKHQDELGIGSDDYGFVSQNQANPDLKRYILENLE